ncbi:MAG: RNase adapter RapZ [Butyrivibrio sp.]|nr:RNase adapter RapZ [Butyrivibrio sp.]
MRMVIVTGMSGAGKRTALKVFEDAGYYCVDNLPIMLVMKFVELAAAGGSGIGNIAMGVDVRSGESFGELEPVLDRMSEMNFRYEILFLEAEDEVLVKRFKETRRNHPLAGEMRIIDGISKERGEIAFLKKRADYIIDTSTLLTRELKQELEKIFVNNGEFSNLVVTVISFGFKYGIPEDADLLFDVRFLPNPFYIDELKRLTGNDAPVRDYVMGFEEAQTFLAKLTDMLAFLIPNYISEGKNRLVIAVGCTGGKHRSVTLANALFERLKGHDYGLKIEHRDIDLDARTKK